MNLYRRAGRINDVKQYLDAAENSSTRSSNAGLAYNKGLFYRYTNEPQKALKELNIARFDGFFGESAVHTMIEIYLNPANEMIWSSLGETEYSTTPDNIQAA